MSDMSSKSLIYRAMSVIQYKKNPIRFDLFDIWNLKQKSTKNRLPTLGLLVTIYKTSSKLEYLSTKYASSSTLKPKLNTKKIVIIISKYEI